jgi:hypothetical protein
MLTLTHILHANPYKKQNTGQKVNIKVKYNNSVLYNKHCRARVLGPRYNSTTVIARRRQTCALTGI